MQRYLSAYAVKNMTDLHKRFGDPLHAAGRLYPDWSNKIRSKNECEIKSEYDEAGKRP